MGISFAEKHPELASEFSERNLPLMASDITYGCDRQRRTTMAQKRLSDKGRQVLRKGEGQRSNGSYYYRWTDQAGERHTIYSKSLTVLREREKELDLDKA